MIQGSGLLKSALFRNYKTSQENEDNFAKTRVQICQAIKKSNLDLPQDKFYFFKSLLEIFNILLISQIKVYGLKKSSDSPQ